MAPSGNSRIPRNTRALEARRAKEAMRDLLLVYRSRIEDVMRPTGITLPQLRMLHAIDQQRGDVGAATIARDCHITPQTLQSILIRATREGWIVRGTSPRNGRLVTATLTSTGKSILAQAMATVAEVDEQIWHGIPLKDMESMRETIERALRNLQDHGG